MRKLAIIPARGGSKRIPRKNIKDFLGKPIIAYSIETALQSGLFDEVMVSTDDAEIAEVAVRYGAKVPFLRSAENSNDHAGTGAVLKEVLTQYETAGQQFDVACCIYPTSPLLTAVNLSAGYAKLSEGGYNTVLSVTEYSYPVWRSYKEEANGTIQPLFPQYMKSRSQDLEPVFHDAGQFYWFSVAEFLKTGSLLSDNNGSVVLSNLEVQDIDTETDWQLAELKYKLNRQ